MLIRYWCFEKTRAEAAAKAFAAEVSAGEGHDRNEAIERIIRDFLHSRAARDHGLIKEYGDPDGK